MKHGAYIYKSYDESLTRRLTGFRLVLRGDAKKYEAIRCTCINWCECWRDFICFCGMCFWTGSSTLTQENWSDWVITLGTSCTSTRHSTAYTSLLLNCQRSADFWWLSTLVKQRSTVVVASMTLMWMVSMVHLPSNFSYKCWKIWKFKWQMAAILKMVIL